MCGEQRSSSAFFSSVAGSPPRVRGAALANAKMDDVVRITPACAGSRGLPKSITPVFRDHPRVCGEQ